MKALTYAQIKALHTVAVIGASNMTGHIAPELIGWPMANRLEGFGLVEAFVASPIHGDRVRLTAAGKEILMANGFHVPPVATLG